MVPTLITSRIGDGDQRPVRRRGTCDRAKAAGFTCLDIYHAFSGPNGNDSLRPFTIDGAHPNQAGSDLIASMLAELDASAIAP